MRDYILSKGILFIWVIFSFLLVVAYAEEIRINTRAPEFSLIDLEENNVSLKEYSGKVVAIFFWATWCPYCQKETPRLVKLKQEFGDRLEILAINYREDVGRVRKFASKYGINYKILLDKKGGVFKLYNIVGVPAVLVLDDKGFVQFKGDKLPDNYREIFEGLSM